MSKETWRTESGYGATGVGARPAPLAAPRWTRALAAKPDDRAIPIAPISTSRSGHDAPKRGKTPRLSADRNRALAFAPTNTVCLRKPQNSRTKLTRSIWRAAARPRFDPWRRARRSTAQGAQVKARHGVYLTDEARHNLRPPAWPYAGRTPVPAAFLLWYLLGQGLLCAITRRSTYA